MAEGTIKKKKAQAFWRWLLENKDRLSAADKAAMSRAELTEVLHTYNEMLSFEIVSSEEGVQELIITAEGNRDEFAAVGRLTGYAPKIEGWKITAFKQAEGFAKAIKHKGLTLDPANMWFLPLSNPDRPDELGLRIGIADLKSEQIQDATDGAWMVVDRGLGEKTSGDEIQHIEVCPLPDDPKKQGYVVLNEIEAFIQWRQEHKCEDNADPGRERTLH